MSICYCEIIAGEQMGILDPAFQSKTYVLIMFMLHKSPTPFPQQTPIFSQVHPPTAYPLFHGWLSSRVPADLGFLAAQCGEIQ